MMIEPIVKDLLEAGVHFGHQTHRWNPKMRRYIYAQKNGIYILDLEKTARGLSEAREFLRKVAAEGGPILFVGTKRQAQPIVAEEARRCGQFYVSVRWLGGLLTNFQTVRKSIARLKELTSWKEDGTLDRMKKKEAARAGKELGKLEKVLSGIQDMPRLPKAIYIIDAKREATAIAEAIRLGIPVVSLVDTNSDPDPISYVIPGNDDAIRSIKLVTGLLANSILEGHQQYLAGQAEVAAKQAADRQAQEDAETAEAAPAPEPTLAIDEVEAIIPDAALKTKIELDESRKKKLPKAKPPIPGPEKGPAGG